MKTSVHRKPTSDAVEILNRTFGNSPERRQAIDKEVQALRQIHSRFTEQQINDYCQKIENLCLTYRADGALLFEGVQIIRHLQAIIRQLKKGMKPSKSHNCEEFYCD